MKNLKKNIQKEIIKLGFDSIGYSEPYVDEKTKQRYKNFLNKNYHGDMKWLERHFEKKTNPKKVWDKVETIIVLGQNYGPKENPLFLNKVTTRPSSKQENVKSSSFLIFSTASANKSTNSNPVGEASGPLAK